MTMVTDPGELWAIAKTASQLHNYLICSHSWFLDMLISFQPKQLQWPI